MIKTSLVIILIIVMCLFAQAETKDNDTSVSSGVLNLELNGLFFSDYLGQACFFPRCLDRAGQPGSVFSG